ncbi:MFS transporter [Bacillus sp. UMB0893]|uniref:MFS transporter n=1 Tax=Bacillus sp. UMB0893 TaxID=2066053 RepID=UPI000C77B4DE|nr:MFS transporter [Bacillus sp. UMB0893]PLR67197.1 MFS transporter [Bacillus sp. UMB0893]
MADARGLLKNKSYLYLISSQAVSSLGDWLDMLAIFALVGLKWEAGSFEMAMTGMAMFAPMIVLSPFCGVLADRYDRKKLMIFSDVIRAAVVVGFVFAPSLPYLLVLLVMKSGFGALFDPAKNGKIKEIVDGDHMQQAVSISGIIENGSKIIGPVISGILVSTAGVYWAFYLDALTFVVSALLLIKVPKSKFLMEKHEGDTGFMLWKQMKEGLFVLQKTKLVFTGLWILCLTLLVIQIIDTQLMILLREIENVNPVSLSGIAIAANGIGMLVFSIFLTRLKIPALLPYLGMGALILGICIVTMPLSIHLPITVIWIMFPIGFFLSGIAAGAIFIPFQLSVQKAVPVEYTGRVFGTIDGMTTLAALIGMVGGGILAERFGAVFAYLFSGTLLIAVGTITMLAKNRLEGGKVSAKGERNVQGETPA